MSDALVKLDATGQLFALGTRRIGAEELLDASLALADKLNPKLNAVTARDVDRARRAAKVYDERRAAGEGVEALGPLGGLPMTIKDSLDVEGLGAVCGVPAYKGRHVQDAVTVARARAAGAVLWGKTNLPAQASDWQSYNPVYGQTNNPWDLARTPGGSSGGAAAAVATGITALEIGSDIGGSLRVPASFCGVYSHKPTFGLVSTFGHIPPKPGMQSTPDLGVVGPIARSARDLRLLLSVIAESPVPAKAPPADLTETRIGLWLEDPYFTVDPEVRDVVQGFAELLAAQGAKVETLKSPIDGEQLYGVYMTLLLGLTGADLPDMTRAVLTLLRPALGLLGGDPRAPARMLRNYTATHAEWLAAHEQRTRFQARLKGLFERYDVILAPNAPVPAFPHDHSRFETRKLKLSTGRSISYMEMLDWPALATVCGLPATAIPAGRAAGGLPVGVQLIGPRGGDSKTLAVAEAIEANVAGFTAPPMDWRKG
jgi:amidase